MLFLLTLLISRFNGAFISRTLTNGYGIDNFKTKATKPFEGAALELMDSHLRNT